MKRVVSLLTVLLVLTGWPKTAVAQSPQSESDWRTDYKLAQRDKASGKLMKWAGIAMAAGGAGIAAYGLFAKKGAVLEQSEALTARATPTYTYSVREIRQPNDSMVVAGLGIAGGGMLLAVFGAGKFGKADKQLKDLERIAGERGWKISFDATQPSAPAFLVSYRW